METFFFTCLLTGVALSGGEDDAYKYAGRAFYYEQNIDDSVKRIERLYVSKDVKRYASYVAPLIEITAKRRISFKWTF